MLARHRVYRLPSLLLVLALLITPGLQALSQPVDESQQPQEAAREDFTAARDFGDALTMEAVDLSAAGEGAEGTEGLEGLLHWAISHSDTDALRKQAEEVQTEQAVEHVVRTMAERKERVQELHKIMSQQPTEIDVMKEAIAMLVNVTSDESDLLGALEALQMLSEPIDNANDLRVLGGIAPVVAQLGAGRGPRLHERAAHVLGTAASNNPQFQRDLLQEAPRVMMDLLRIAASGDVAAATKGLYAVGSIVRNTDAAVAAFLSAGGVDALGKLLASPAAPWRLKQRALNIVLDVSTGDRKNGPVLDAVLQQGGAVSAIVWALDGINTDSVASDAAEPALLAVQALLRNSPSARSLLLEAGAGKAAMQLLVHQQNPIPAAAAGGDDDDGADDLEYQQYITKLAQEVVFALLGGGADGRLLTKTKGGAAPAAAEPKGGHKVEL